MQRFPSLVSPRVCAACFSTIWNRWTTARRFQRRHLACNRCALGCEGGAEDSVEHYVHCPVVAHVASRYLRLRINFNNAKSLFLLSHTTCEDSTTLSCAAILVYATYCATNHYRQKGGASFGTAADALEQHCRQAVEGHSSSAALLDGRWVAEPLPARRRISS